MEMRNVSPAMRIGLLVGALALAGVALAETLSFTSVGYTLDDKDGKLAVFSCDEASRGRCYLKVGGANGVLGYSLDVKRGEKVQLTVSDSVNTLCYSAEPNIDWQACLKSDARLDLSKPAKASSARTATLKFSTD